MSAPFPRRAGWLPALVLVLFVISAQAAAGKGKGDNKDPKSKNQPFALLFGTVFDETGHLVRGAQIEVRPNQPVEAGRGGRPHAERWESRSDSAGEFAVRLPAGKAVYTVEARAPGLLPDRKEVEFTSDERQDVVLHMKRP